jgi:hypothetical protein
MATLEELRDRSDALFTELLKAQATAQPAEPGLEGIAPAARTFSWFDREDGVRAATLAFRLSALAASGETVEDGLGAALDLAEAETQHAPAEEVQIGLALFVTHNREGRRLAKPRTVTAAPELFSPPVEIEGEGFSVGGLSPGLDYWREDVLANEHHQHWHEVYPWPGVPPRSFADWLSSHTTAELVEILVALAPSQPWQTIVPTLSPQQLARLFGQVVNAASGSSLRRDLYVKLFRLNDRQGELFLYMHEQMLARYDAELLSNGNDRVKPFDPNAWTSPIAAGQNPVEITGFGERPPNQTLPASSVAELQSLWDEIDTALHDKKLLGPGGTTVAIDRENLGEAIEATTPQLRSLAEDAYGGIHNDGHVQIANLADPAGVMISPVAAIRDQVFWQWHKAIDDLSFRWQETQAPYSFDDAPPVKLRDGLASGAAQPWASPDIILCRTTDLPQGTNPPQLGTQLFGGDNWSTDFTAAQASAGGTTLQTIGELTTKMATGTFGGRPITFLTHEPFSYFLRIENPDGAARNVTVRIFLAPADLAEDRRMWMEMDKFLVELPAEQRVVVYQPDTESSIVRRPVDLSPPEATPGGTDPDENSYCDCGWPYTLLLPRGTEAGMTFRLMAICTDATIDRVGHAEHCGSMSYCGAVDRYPDTRDMGYPFSRPFGAGANVIRDKILALDCAAARTITIKHTA